MAEETIAQVEGKRIDDPNYGSDYCVDMGGSMSLEPSPPFRYLNHSCDANCELVVFKGEEDSLFLVALRDIQPDDPLTIDYEWPADSPIPCGCNSSNCRGWVVAARETKKLVKGSPAPRKKSAT